MKFTELRLSQPILRAVQGAGYTTATPIQAQAIPPILDGRDVLGCAQTGTGKTAAFALPVIPRLADQARRPKGPRLPRCLILCPTRELAGQISKSFQTYGRNVSLRHAVIFGGVSQNPQVAKLRAGVDAVVATPGRLIDLINQGHVDLSHIETLVLDEADRMLDMGFIGDIRRIATYLPDRPQTLLFSATMPPAIRKLASQLMNEPLTIQDAPAAAPADGIDQSVYFVDKPHKTAMLVHLLSSTPISRAIVFTRTKHGADRVVRDLRHAKITAEAIHGNKSQAARTRSLDRFRGGRVHVLIATDVASRGIHIDQISHVFNYDLSHDPESYIHRIGRTARAGAVGAAISFCDPQEHEHLRAIERLIQRRLPVQRDHPSHVPAGKSPTGASARRSGSQSNRRGVSTRRPHPMARRTAARAPKGSRPRRSRRP